MKKGFTLVELLVVIGILGILSAVLIGSFAGGTESARAVKCLTNMRNLATACQTYGMSYGFYPLAGSIECVGIDESQGIKNVKMRYRERPGWISWDSQGAYAGTVQSHIASASWMTSSYDQDDIKRTYALTNGVLWKHISGNRELFVCPEHTRLKRFQRTRPLWTYVMNSYFGWDNSKGGSAKPESFYGIRYDTLDRADRRLLLAELQFQEGYTSEPVDDSASAGTVNDCVLQYKTNEGGELIGFNHTAGKRTKVAHVVFADAHTEKLTMPKSGLSSGDHRKLTEWLCTGTDFTFKGDSYEELK